MAKPFSEWTVLPHGRLTRIDDNLLCVTGVLSMPAMGDMERRMTVVRLADGRLIVYSAIALDEAEMSALENFGALAYLVVPSDIHRMDAKVWKERYPRLKVVAPAGARAKVEEIVPVDLTEVDFHDPAVRFVTVPGTGEREAALLVETASGTTLIVNDLIFNLANRSGASGWLFKLIGMTGDDPHMPPVIRMRQVEDKDALRAQLERWSQLRNLKRVIISHGSIIDADAPRVLSRIAEALAA
ncbi:MAG TPA: hypothetical protein VGI10_11790 [Polyangiaceae bacterium]|jgi:hypothetical protein